MASSGADDLANNLANLHLSSPDPPATDTTTGEVKPGLLRLPQELYDIIFREVFRDVVLVYHSDGGRASLRPVRGSPAQAHATVVVGAGRRELGRDTRLRGTAFWARTRRFRRLHAAPGAVGAGPVFAAAHLRSLVCWNEAYQLRDLLHLWPRTAVLILGAVTITAVVVPAAALLRARCAPAVPQDLVFAQLVAACHASHFILHGTVCQALRRHGIAQGVTFLVRFRIQVPVWCERDEEVVQRDICHGVLNPETGHVEYHEAMGFRDQRLPSSAMAALVDPNLAPDAASARPLPSDQRAWSFNQMWEAVRNSRA